MIFLITIVIQTVKKIYRTIKQKLQLKLAHLEITNLRTAMNKGEFRFESIRGLFTFLKISQSKLAKRKNVKNGLRKMNFV